MASKHALLIGVSRYGEGLPPIPSALVDVDALAEVLRDPELGDFPEAQVQVLKDPERSTMEQEVETFFASRDSDDLLLLYFSGHGVRENSRLLLGCRGTTKFMEGPERGKVRKSTAVRAEDVQRYMESSRSRRQLLILDCCYSAAFVEGMGAKGDGAIGLEETFGGRGRAVLTSSDSIETSMAPESGDDLSVYTRFLVEGIRTGSADRDQRGFIDAEDLHTYVSRRVAEAAPTMSPQFFPTREGHRIVVCQVRRDPRVAYRQEVEKRAGIGVGVVSPAGRMILKERRAELGISDGDAERIEAEVFQPWREYKEKKSRFAEIVAEYVASGSELSAADWKELRELEGCWKLRPSDVEEIMRRYGFFMPLEDLPSSLTPTPLVPAEHPFSLQRFCATTAVFDQKAGHWRVERRPVLVEGYQEELAEGVALTMVKIPAGSFHMGSPEDETGHSDEEGPQHEVALGTFFLGQTPITQAQWRVVAAWKPLEGDPAWERELKVNPLETEGDLRFHGDDRPVVHVSWQDAMEFCRRLQYRTGKSYTLPSEAQWEYACRAKSSTAFCFGEELTPELSNYTHQSNDPDGLKYTSRGQTSDVGIFPVNDWCLYDMHGNVWEWCLDHWHESYSIIDDDEDEVEEAPTNGEAWSLLSTDDDEPRVLRGGSWSCIPEYCRSAARNSFPAQDASEFVGFRICCLSMNNPA